MNPLAAIPGVHPTRVRFVTPVADHEIAHLKPARTLLKLEGMGAPKLRRVNETPDLDVLAANPNHLSCLNSMTKGTP